MVWETLTNNVVFCIHFLKTLMNNFVMSVNVGKSLFLKTGDDMQQMGLTQTQAAATRTQSSFTTKVLLVVQKNEHVEFRG